MDKISVVVCCYNVSDDIFICWDSIKNQSVGIENIECIFVDDASTDDGLTWQKLSKIEQDAPESVMIIHSEKNGGPGGALNLGISYATGKYLQLMGADDELMHIALETLYNIAEDAQADIVQYNHTLILGDTRKVNTVSPENKLILIENREDRIQFLNATIVTYGCTNKFYRLDLVRRTNSRFAENVVYEEPLFVYPLFLYADRIAFCKEGLYLYHLHEGSIVTSKIGKKLLDHPKVQLMLLADLMGRKELFESYRDVIECYFLWSFYCETIMFAAENKGAYLPLEYFIEMQNACRTYFPNWRDNKMIQSLDKFSWNLMETIDEEFDSQNRVNELIAGVQSKK